MIYLTTLTTVPQKVNPSGKLLFSWNAFNIEYRNLKNNIPEELKALPQWGTWRTNSSAKKLPLNPKTGRYAKSNDRETWCEFKRASAYYLANKNRGVRGIGFFLSEDDPFVVIDLDACRNPATGDIAPRALDIINRFSSFTEVSPSGTGVHIWIKGKLPPGGRKKGSIEIYDSRRFMTVTGHTLVWTPTTVEERQGELEAFHGELFPQAQESETQGKTQGGEGNPAPGANLTDEELLERAFQAKNGEKFQKLWDGDYSDYDSPSEADLALTRILAFWVGNDPERIDRLFRKSKLMRPKWDERRGERTYGQITIGKAIDSSQGVHSVDGPRGKTSDEDSPLPLSIVPRFPAEVMAGAAGRFAKAYTQYLETPEAFLFMDYLALLGHLISDKITLESEIRPQPRLYLVNLGESADTRKTTSINMAMRLFQETVNPDDLNLILGVGSAEGLARALRSQNRGILILDELKALIQKMRIDTSVLLPCINTLFEVNQYHNMTSNQRIRIVDAELCLLGASTLETYSNMFTPQFLDIGFLNRLFIVIGESQRKFAIPQPMPDYEKETLREDLRQVLAFVQRLAADGRFSLPLDPQAREIFESWYMSLEQSVFAKRLDTYGHRLMPLLAVNERQDRITPEIAERTLALLDYQLSARKFADPIDADNAIAKLEEKVRRVLNKGPVKKRDLERVCHKNRAGNWCWNKALKNLIEAGEIGFNNKKKIYHLAPNQ